VSHAGATERRVNGVNAGPNAKAVDEVARTWLTEMEACVRSVDFARCRAIFADDVVGLGTRAALVVGLDALERDQWRHIWGTIRGFTFLLDDLHGGGDGEVVWLACPWTSEGQTADGTWNERRGRITAVLERRTGRWLAVHTHHSLAPTER
jgi:ketosteroid isomerase-like protein